MKIVFSSKIDSDSVDFTPRNCCHHVVCIISEMLKQMTQRIANMAYYRPKDWSRLLSIVDDKEVFHETWEEWHKQYLMTKRHLESEGLKINDVVVEIDELISFCFQRGIKNDAKARSHFVSLIKK